MRILLFILVVLAAGVCIEKPAEAQNGGWCAYLNYGYGGQRIATAVNRRPPVSFKALIRRGSRLAVMHANNDSLGVRSASVSGSDAEGRPLEVRQSARPAFFIWSHCNCGRSSRLCPADDQWVSGKTVMMFVSGFPL